MKNDALLLSEKLIGQPSVTPNDNGCQDILINELKPLGFTIKNMPFGDVSNLWAIHGSNTKPLFAFAGHTDVVPPGPEDEWQSPPFEASIRHNYLFGRGAADMKTGLAAMVTAVKFFLKENPNPPFRIAFLITSNEEGNAIGGTRNVIDELQKQNIHIDWCLVGEPSSDKKAGDIIKIGRRGSLHGYLKIFGKQGHIAYLDQKDNPIHRSFKALQELTEQTWDFKPNPHFPPTTMQISNLNAGVGADNVVPGEVDVMFNFRFSTATTAEYLQEVTEAVLDKHQLKYRLEWRLSGKPFLTNEGKLLESAINAVKETTNISPELSTVGGTSDGRFIAPTGSEVIELGVCNKTIHQIDECIALADLELVSQIYLALLKHLSNTLSA